MSQFQNWLYHPGDVKRIIYGVPGSEYNFVGKNETLDEAMYYEVGKQGASFYQRQLTSIGHAWAKWPNPGYVSGVSAKGDAWLIFDDNLTRKRTVLVQSIQDSPAAYETNDPALTTARDASLAIAAVSTLGFPSVVPGTLRWVSPTGFEAEVFDMGQPQEPRPKGRLTATVTALDRLGRPTRIAYHNSFVPEKIQTFVDYSYEGAFDPPWFPTLIRHFDQLGSTSRAGNTRFINLVELGTEDNLPDGYTPNRFLEASNLTEIAVIFSSNGLYYAASKEGIKRIYRAEDLDKPKEVTLFRTRGPFFATSTLLFVVLFFSLRGLMRDKRGVQKDTGPAN